MANQLKEPAREIITLDFLLEIEKLRQEKSSDKWMTIIDKINNFTRSYSSCLSPVDLKNAVLHTAYGEALSHLSRKEEAFNKFKLGLDILSLVLLNLAIGCYNLLWNSLCERIKGSI
jgi:hypothetical protein